METPVTDPWRKATYSGSNGGGCVEVARTPERLLVRDTTNRPGGHIAVTAEAWAGFLAALR